MFVRVFVRVCVRVFVILLLCVRISPQALALQVVLDLSLEFGAAAGGWSGHKLELTRALSDPRNRVEAKLVQTRLMELITGVPTDLSFDHA